MTELTLALDAIGAADLHRVGGKGANLGELILAGMNVPSGFCVTTAAFSRFMAGSSRDFFADLESLAADDLERLRRVGSAVRQSLERVPLPEEVCESALSAWEQIGRHERYAVRSSATAEDLPGASFAGQHDTYLNVIGAESLLQSIRRCFISLFTDRAILYRLENGFDHRQIALAVVVQKMVPAEAAGILFTADPVSGNRRIASIDASFGLGEAVVSGLVSPDLYQVDRRDYRIIKRQIASKRLAIRPLVEGDTERVELQERDAGRAALSDAQVIELTRLGNAIEAHFGQPQDIEWAQCDGRFYVTQSRPITSLYPLPQPRPEDDSLHVYASLSHFQVMTEAITPLALSVLRTVISLGRRRGKIEGEIIKTAGGRMYGDLSLLLRHPVGRRHLPRVSVNADPLAAVALARMADREDFLSPGSRLNPLRLLPILVMLLPRVVGSLIWISTDRIIAKVNEKIDDHLAGVKRRLEQGSPSAKFELAIEEMHGVLRVILSWAPHLMAGTAAGALLSRLTRGRADAKLLAALGRGLNGNVETEMNLAVGDLADAARASHELLSLLHQTQTDPTTRIALAAEAPGGEAFREAWQRFMETYGARGPGEIDLRRARWFEDPSSLLQMVLNATRSVEPGLHRAHYRRLQEEAELAEKDLIAQARKGRAGWLRARVTARLIKVSRNLGPLRGHHKYLVMRLLALIKPVLGETGAYLHAQSRLGAPADIWFLSLPEIKEALSKPDQELKSLIDTRRSEFEHHRGLIPPRVITSDGEIPSVQMEGVQAPEGALIGSPVSAGIAEGFAKVILDPSAEVLNPGEILVAPFTDPGWTPLFVSAAGLVTEVGGLMTHGSVVAREYGIPAVVGVIEATRRIKTGQRIRVHGEAGYVELLDSPPSGQGDQSG